ncbi:CbtA family protein [Mesorhizobium metallidurans]|nr:CbtA family protein [Mesorhizobium metallidurans]
MRGLIIGLLAGILAFPVARIFGGPPVESAIAIEEQNSVAAGGGHGEAPLVSRDVQRTLGLGSGLLGYGAGIGGILALVLAFANGRLGAISPRAAAATVAGLGFVSVVLVPGLIYPANPPAVGDPETISYRSQLFGLTLLLSIAAMVVAVWLARRFAGSFGSWNAAIIAALGYLAFVGIVRLALPYINEVPDTFPATVLWQFRIASLLIQGALWTVIAIGLGVFTEREFLRPGPGPQRANLALR